MICILTVSALAFSHLAAEEIHFFGNGDFSKELGLYGYGQGKHAFSADRNTMVKWESLTGYMRIALTENAEKGRARIRSYHSARLPAGLQLQVRVKMRGIGKARFEVANTGIRTQWATLTDQWQEYKLSLDCSNSCIGSVHNLFLHLEDRSAYVELDDLTITAVTFDGLIVPPVGALVVKPGNIVPKQTFHVYPRDLRGHFLLCSPGSAKTVRSPAEALLGKVTHPGFTAEEEGVYRLIFTTGGISAMRDIVVIPEADLVELENAAQKVDLKGKPLRMLWLADSLTDNDRDHNHAAITAGLLNKYNPGLITFRNAGIGGDTSRNLQYRLESDHPVLRKYMYDGIWQETYDIIFISLGQNDTVAYSKTQFKKPRLPVKQVEDHLRAVIRIIRKKSKARIVIVSGFSTPVNTSPNYRFGIPGLVENYNNCAQKVALENGAEYFDLYNILKNCSKRPVPCVKIHCGKICSVDIDMSFIRHIKTAEQFDDR